MNEESANTSQGPVGEAPGETPFLLANVLPSKEQVRLAFAIVVALLVAFGVTAPFTYIQLPRVDAFIPGLAVAVLINDLFTSALLFAQFSVVRRFALLVLASGFLYTALIVIPFALSFPGLFAATGLLGAGLQSTPWLYVFWHVGSPLAVAAYVLTEDVNSRTSAPLRSPAAVICWSIAVVIALVCGLTWLATAGDWLLPRILFDNVQMNHTLALLVGGLVILSDLVALALLWFRRRSVLDLWLMVMCCAWLLEAAMSIVLIDTRFSLGWYAGRIYGLISTLFVLLVLVSETTALYARLARSIMRRRREHEGRLMTMDSVTASIAHEVNQPLAALVANGNAALHFLAAATPDLGEVRAAVKSIVSDGHRAAEVIESIRAMFKNVGQERAALDINKLIRDVLVLVLGELRAHQVSVQTDLNDKLPDVRGNRVQLQQVILNLITNALDAMNSVTNRPRVLRLKSVFNQSDGVLVLVEDSGTGIDPNNIDRIFDSFFTTKSQGIGMGLSLCRSIIEAHDGRLWASSELDHGTVFNVLLPSVRPGGEV